MKKAYLIIAVAILLFAMDMILTIYYIKNYYHLVGEGNPLASTEYGYLILPVNALYFVFITIAAIVYGRYKTIVLESKNVLEYTKNIYLSQHSGFIFVNGCFTLIVASFVSRTTAIVDWLVFGFYKETFFQSEYAIIRSLMPLGRYDVIAGVITAIIAIPLWFYVEFKKSSYQLKKHQSL